MAWTEERIRRGESWDKFWTGMIVAVTAALCFMLVVDPLKRQPVLGDRGAAAAGPAGNIIPLDLGMK